MASRVLTVMFTDIKGFTERTSQTSRQALRNLLEEHEQLLLPVASRFGGNLIKTIGDALLLTFESPTNAVLCGMMIQETLREHNEAKPDDERILVRVAINTGEVEMREGDVFGEPVNIASRIEGIAEPNEIYFTESVYLAMNKSEVPSSSIGERRLRGIPEAIKLYRVIQDPNSETFRELIRRLKEGKFDDMELPSTGGPPSGSAVRPAGRSKASVLVGIVALLAAAVAGVVLLARDPIGDARGAVQQALDAGDLELARSRAESMKRKFPESEVAVEAVRAVEAAVFDGERKSVESAVAAKNISLALTQADAMIGKYAGNEEVHEIMRLVIAAETDDYIAKDRFKDALDILKKRKEERSWLNIDPYRKKVILAEADSWYKVGQMANAGSKYSSLMYDYPKDLEIRRVIVEKMGPKNKYGTYRIAVYAALHVAEGTTGALDELLSRTLVDGLDEWYPEYESAVRIRKLLIERCPNCVEALRGIVVSTKPEKHESDWNNSRANALVILKEMKKLDPDDEASYHYISLVKSSTMHRKHLQAAVAFFEEARQQTDWQQRKAKLNIKIVEPLPSQRRFSETQRSVADLLVKAFRPEIDNAVVEWVKTAERFEVRVNAFKMLEQAGIADRVDAWVYHKKNIMGFGPTFTPVAFRDALAYFSKGDGAGKKAEAGKVLGACRARIEKLMKWYEKNKSRGWLEQAKINMGLIDEASRTLATGG